MPPETRQSVADLQRRLQVGCRFIDAHPRWVAPENLHLTLVFLGSIAEDCVPIVTRAMESVAHRHFAFELETARLDLFPPNSKQLKVISADIMGQRRLLKSLQKDLSDTLRGAGFEVEDRPYKPHLTIARLPSVKTASRVGALVASHSEALKAKFPVEEIVLFESVTLDDRLEYRPLHLARLQDGVKEDGD